MSQDLAQDVREMAEAAIRKAGAGSEGFRVSVTWMPGGADMGNAVIWYFLITLPSHLIGMPPLGVTCGPLLSPSLPFGQQVDAMVAQALPALRESRGQQDRQVVSDAAANLGRLN